jgi:hypothetical protein
VGVPVAELLSWALVVGASLACVGLAFNALQVISSADEFWIAKMWFSFAAVIPFARFVVWAYSTHRSITLRLIVCFLACGGMTWAGIEAIRYVNRKHDRWLAQQQPAEAKSQPLRQPASRKREGRARPNLLDRGVRIRRAHQDLWAQVLVEGANDNRYGGFDPDWQVLTIEICNEFRVSPKTAPVANVTAEITYTFPDGSNFKLNRGAWLGGANRIGFNVNDDRHLIIVGSLMRTPGEARIFVKEYPRISGGMNSFIHLDTLMGTLPANQDYPVEIRLISESEGEHYATFNYMLSIDAEGDGPLNVDLIEASDWKTFKKDKEDTNKARKGDA